MTPSASRRERRRMTRSPRRTFLRGLLLPLAVLAALTACATAPAAAASKLPLRLSVVYTQSTRRAIEWGREADRQNARWGIAPIAVDERVADLLETLEERFEAVELAEGAAGAKADLTGHLDVRVQYPSLMGSDTARFDASLKLMTPDGRRLAVVGGENFFMAREVRSGYTTDQNERTAWNMIFDTARRRLGAELDASGKLAEYARGRGVTAPPPPAESAPPAAAPRQPPADKPSYRLPEAKDNFAVVIGIEKYAGLPEARFAERDASAVRRHLEALGYPARNIVLLTGAAASRAGIAKNVETWLARNVNKRSTVFVYYSGHGAPDPVKGDAYLVPADGDPQYLQDTAYPVKQLYERLERLEAARVIVALDACFSGAGERSLLAKGTRPLVTKVDMAGEALKKTLVLSASAADQISGTSEEQEHGLFTYHLLRGLNETRGRGKARDIHAYLSPRVQDEARRANRDQTPQLIPAAAGAREDWEFR